MLLFCVETVKRIKAIILIFQNIENQPKKFQQIKQIKSKISTSLRSFSFKTCATLIWLSWGLRIMHLWNVRARRLNKNAWWLETHLMRYGRRGFDLSRRISWNKNNIYLYKYRSVVYLLLLICSIFSNCSHVTVKILER